MKLSLSVRIAESFHSKTTSEMSIDEISELARSIGYSALCMRASQAGNVYVQNHRIARDGVDSVETWHCGRVALHHIGVWEPGGVEVEKVFDELRRVGYTGCVTVHQAFGGVMPPAEAARKSFEYLSALTAG